MKKYLLPVFSLVIAAAFIFPSCLKEKQTTNTTPTIDSSWWMVDTQRFVTYNNFVTGTQSHVIISGAASPGNNKYSITFNLSYIPAQGNYLLDCSNPGSTAACMEITYNGMRYRAGLSPAVYLHADSANQRAILNLNGTWFYNTIDPTHDSIAVLGVFRQPQ